MLRLIHQCLIAVCLAGSLMLLPLCCAGGKVTQLEPEYESTASPDYDYNATFDYSFFSNSSTEELEMFFLNNESVDENEGLDIIPNPVSTESTISDEAFRTVYSSLLLMLLLAAHQLLRLL